MMTTRRLLLVGSLLALGLAGCDTTNEPVTPSNTKVANLTALSWHITAYTRATGSGAATDYLATMFPRSCERDDRYTFKTNGVEERTEGPTACPNSGSNPVVQTSAWNFNSSQTQLTIDGNPFDVVQLTADVMQLRWTHSVSGTTAVDNVRYEN